EVERYLAGPVLVGARQGGGRAGLADDAQAARGLGTRRQPELRPVGGEVGLGGRVVERVDDGDRRPRDATGRQLVGGGEVGGGVAGRDVVPGQERAGVGTPDRVARHPVRAGGLRAGPFGGRGCWRAGRGGRRSRWRRARRGGRRVGADRQGG